MHIKLIVGSYCSECLWIWFWNLILGLDQVFCTSTCLRGSFWHVDPRHSVVSINLFCLHLIFLLPIGLTVPRQWFSYFCHPTTMLLGSWTCGLVSLHGLFFFFEGLCFTHQLLSARFIPLYMTDIMLNWLILREGSRIIYIHKHMITCSHFLCGFVHMAMKTENIFQ
jgi:hypothetical protein